MTRMATADTIAAMSCVLFVAPFFMEATTRFIEAVASLPGIAFGLISQDPEEKLPPALRERLAGHYRISDGTSAEQITAAAAKFRPLCTTPAPAPVWAEPFHDACPRSETIIAGSAEVGRIE